MDPIRDGRQLAPDLASGSRQYATQAPLQHLIPRRLRFAARATADRKALGHLSYLITTLRQSFNRPNMISIYYLAAHAYMREKAVAFSIATLVILDGFVA
jgi:hypothetical protein